jgi:dolichol-phosphate mannosyltransferase
MFKFIEIPKYNLDEFASESRNYCVCLPVINEGDRIRRQLQRMSEAGITNYADIIICDGGSNDGSLNPKFLKTHHISALLTKQDTGGLSAQLRMGYYYALVKRSYKGVITIDGNNKDSVEDIVNFVKKLEEGYDLVQGSRFIEGGKAINTPLIRKLAVKLIHIPLISLIAGFRYSDTTNGFRGYSRKFLEDWRVEPFRKIFDSYELLPYLAVRAPELHYKVLEIPVTRIYPKKGKTPTKISFIKGNLKLLSILKNICQHKYDHK